MASNRVTVAMMVERHPAGRCSPPGEDWACGCAYVGVERTVVAEVTDDGGRLLFLYDEDGHQLRLGELSMQEQERACDLAAMAFNPESKSEAA